MKLTAGVGLESLETHAEVGLAGTMFSTWRARARTSASGSLSRRVRAGRAAMPVFVDLNRDDVSPIMGFADRKEIYLPNTALRADLVVSLAKMKTHHWAGATLSMKNFFGLVPGSVYGWPKNELHQVGIQSIVELSRIFPAQLCDRRRHRRHGRQRPHSGHAESGGSTGDGLRSSGGRRHLLHIMGIDPSKVPYLQMAADNLGVTEKTRIEQRGEPIRAVRTNFQLIDQFREIRLV